MNKIIIIIIISQLLPPHLKDGRADFRITISGNMYM